MTKNLEEFNEKFQVSELEIASTEHWIWSARPVHSTLGAGILSLKRFCTALDQTTSAEMADLGVITKIVEGQLRTRFQPDKMNYLMLMMVDAHLHFHVFPRYSRQIEFAGTKWADGGWPALPDIGAHPDGLNPDVLLEIRDALKIQ